MSCIKQQNQQQQQQQQMQMQKGYSKVRGDRPRVGKGELEIAGNEKA